MNNKVIIITPHPDDETLGCGGSILKHIQNGDQVSWVIVTQMNQKFYSLEKINTRNKEIKKVNENYCFTKVFQLPFCAAKLGEIEKEELINGISHVFSEVNPNIIYVPYRNDIHSDHKIVFDAAMVCTKWFRYPSVQKVLVYETLSETDFSMNPDSTGFRPNVFVNIEEYIEQKIEIMKIYESEIDAHPFPRSEESIRALATLRGSAAGFKAAEAFMLLKERVL